MAYSADQLPNGLDAKTTPIDADVVVIGDSADSNRARKTTWANVKATLKTYFDTLYAGVLGADDNYVTDAEKVKLSNLTGTNSGDQTTIVGITGTKAQFDTAVTDGNFLYVGDVTTNATHTGDVTGSGALTIDKTAITGKTLATAVGTDYILISDTNDSGNLKKALASDLAGSGLSDGDKGDITVSGSGATWNIDAGVVGVTELSATGTPSASNFLRGDNSWATPAVSSVEGTAVLSTGETGAVKYLREDGDGTCSWQTPAGSGNVSKVGTPVDNQIGVWTGDGTIEGDAGFTFDGGLGITVADAENKVGLTITQNDVTNNNSAVVLNITDGYAIETNSTSLLDVPYFVTYINATGNVANGDLISSQQFDAKSTTGVRRNFAQLEAYAVDATNGAEIGAIYYATQNSGSLNGRMWVGTSGNLDALNGIAVGNGTNAGKVSSYYNTDLILQTGNTTTGNITIVDGADGQISINPNGTGTVKLGTLTGVLRADTGVVSADTDVTDLVSAASTTAAGKVELTIDTEVTTGTSTTLAVTPDSLAGSTIFGRKVVSIQVTDGTTDVTTGDGKAYITIPEALNGMNLVRAQATVVTAGTTNATTVMVHNKTDAQDMLSGAISIASAGTVGTVGTINGTYDDVATNDVLRIDVDSVSTTAPKGLMVVLEFQLP
jgi:hypothetical protein